MLRDTDGKSMNEKVALDKLGTQTNAKLFLTSMDFLQGFNLMNEKS